MALAGRGLVHELVIVPSGGSRFPNVGRLGRSRVLFNHVGTPDRVRAIEDLAHPRLVGKTGQSDFLIGEA